MIGPDALVEGMALDPHLWLDEKADPQNRPVECVRFVRGGAPRLTRAGRFLGPIGGGARRSSRADHDRWYAGTPTVSDDAPILDDLRESHRAARKESRWMQIHQGLPRSRVVEEDRCP